MPVSGSGIHSHLFPGNHRVIFKKQYSVQTIVLVLLRPFHDTFPLIWNKTKTWSYGHIRAALCLPPHLLLWLFVPHRKLCTPHPSSSSHRPDSVHDLVSVWKPLSPTLPHPIFICQLRGQHKSQDFAQHPNYLMDLFNFSLFPLQSETNCIIYLFTVKCISFKDRNSVSFTTGSPVLGTFPSYIRFTNTQNFVKRNDVSRGTWVA